MPIEVVTKPAQQVTVTQTGPANVSAVQRATTVTTAVVGAQGAPGEDGTDGVSPFLVLRIDDPIPENTPIGTVIVRY